MWYSCVAGASFDKQGTTRERRSISSMVKSTSPSLAAANKCSTVLVEPPMAISSAMAFSKALKLAILRGSTESSPCSQWRLVMSTMVRPACLNKASRSVWVASKEPLPGNAKPNASVRQFMELAVNLPEQEPQVGQALRSYSATCSSVALSSAAITMASTRSSLFSDSAVLPASMGPPETNTTGTFKRNAASNMPGVILSQLEIHTMASAQWA